MVYLANKQEQGRYIFGGDSASKPPFAEEGTYQGGENDVNWKLNDGYELKMFRNGKDLLEPVIKTLTTDKRCYAKRRPRCTGICNGRK